MAMRLDQKARLLNALPLFQAMEPQAVHVLAFSAGEQSIAAGETIFTEGALSDGGFVIASGRIRLGDETLGPGTLVGAAALISETERPATALALEPAVLVLLPRVLVLQVLEAHPGSAASLRRLIAAEVTAVQTSLKALLV